MVLIDKDKGEQMIKKIIKEVIDFITLKTCDNRTDPYGAYANGIKTVTRNQVKEIYKSQQNQQSRHKGVADE